MPVSLQRPRGIARRLTIKAADEYLSRSITLALGRLRRRLRAAHLRTDSRPVAEDRPRVASRDRCSERPFAAHASDAASRRLGHRPGRNRSNLAAYALHLACSSWRG